MVKVLRSLVCGPLEPHIAGFAEELLRRGYTRNSAGQHVCFLAHLDRWMCAEGIGLGQLSGPVIDQYLAHRRAAGYVEYRSLKALWPLLDYLAPLGVLPVEEPDPPGPVEELLGRYHRYLVGERGLTARTARGYADSSARSWPPARTATWSTWPGSRRPRSGFVLSAVRGARSGRRS